MKLKVLYWSAVFVLCLTLIFSPWSNNADAQLPVPVPTLTVLVPAPVETIIKELVVPGPTVTVTSPGPTITETVIRNGVPAPTVTVTETITVSPTQGAPTGQATQSSGTVTPEPTPTPDPPVIREGIEEDDDIFISTPEAIGTGLLLLGIGGGLTAIFLAYYRGYKDSDQAEARLTKKLRDDVIGE